MKLNIRPATQTDLLRIHEMDIESYGPQTTPITALIWLVDRQGDRPNLFLSVGEEIAEGAQNLVVGFVAWKELADESGVKTLEILHLVIAKTHRGEGMGVALLEGVLIEAQKRGARGASMHVPASHEGAVKLLTKVGFFEYQRTPGFFQTLGDGILFAKKLN